MVDLDLLSGERVAVEELRASKAQGLALAASQGVVAFCRLVECRRQENHDVVVIEVAVEVGQSLVHAILPVEKLGILFDLKDREAPEVLAVRKDFPIVPHLNLRPWDLPRSLCLFEERYREIKSRWTPAMFIERIRTWLRLTARGELHGDDQPLEPLLLSSAGIIILPHSLFSDATKDAQLRPLAVTRCGDHRGKWVLIARREDVVSNKEGPGFVAVTLRCAPREHGTIHRTPGTLGDLQRFIALNGEDLLGLIRSCILGWSESPGALDARLVLLIAFPKTRRPGGEIEDSDVWAFCTTRPLRDIGEAVGVWELYGGNPGVLIGFDESKTGEGIELVLLNPCFTLSRQSAAFLNGQTAPTDLQIAAVGCGALGSQIIMNAARSAFGFWTLIDDDLLLSHNLTRHSSDAQGVGWPKAEIVAFKANSLIDGGEGFTPIVADVLELGQEADSVRQHFQNAGAILDMSASVAVARYLARDIEAPGRRLSLFLNPRGTDLVLLAEDRERKIPLDALEMQYYRALNKNTDLTGHLQATDDRLRYGRSCRDVSRRIPQELVGLHAAIGVGALRAALASDEATVRIWRVNEESLSVNSIEIRPAAVRAIRLGDWTLALDDLLLERFAELRTDKLPCETGGILLGTFDLERKIAYVVDTLPSPPDSQEWPCLYIRGCKGLPQQVQAVADITAGQLHYVGEWHSHPDEYTCRPSDDDVKVFAWLTKHMDGDGFPALMMIVGQYGVAPFLGRMTIDGAPIDCVVQPESLA
jgi:E2/UBC family protein A/JAB domain-containing protein similar to deubiquitination enzymes/ThiF family protein